VLFKWPHHHRFIHEVKSLFHNMALKQHFIQSRYAQSNIISEIQKKIYRIWVCYWIFSIQCCQVLKRLLRQFNKNIRLFSKITLLNSNFQNSATFPLLVSFFFIVTDNTKTQLFYNFLYLATLLLSGGYGFRKIL
jgi:hypothetical protein